MKLIFYIFVAFVKASVVQAKLSDFELKVVYGSKVSNFKISESNHKFFLERYHNMSADKEHIEISKKNHAYLIKEISKVKGPSNQISFCSRTYIKFNFEQNELVGCLGSTTPLGSKLLELANLLSIIY